MVMPANNEDCFLKSLRKVLIDLKNEFKKNCVFSRKAVSLSNLFEMKYDDLIIDNTVELLYKLFKFERSWPA